MLIHLQKMSRCTWPFTKYLEDRDTAHGNIQKVAVDILDMSDHSELLLSILDMHDHVQDDFWSFLTCMTMYRITVGHS